MASEVVELYNPDTLITGIPHEDMAIVPMTQAVPEHLTYIQGVPNPDFVPHRECYITHDPNFVSDIPPNVDPDPAVTSDDVIYVYASQLE